MKAVLVIDMPKSCIECPCMSWDNEDDWIGCHLTSRQTGVWSEHKAPRPDWCPLKPLNKIVKAGDRNLIIYERAWLYSHLEEEFEMQKKARDWEKKNESRTCD